MDTMLGKIVEEKAKTIPFLPDEIITNILSSLPVRSAMRCRLVCRKWRDLTSTRDFVDLHFKKCVPMILVVAWKSYCRLRIYELDNWWEIATMNNEICIPYVYVGENLYKSRVLFSHDGLVVLQEETDYFEKEIVILNPTRHNIESVSLTFTDEELERSEIYGVYYHPSMKGYCSLWKIESSVHPDRFRYKILNLGSNPSLKTISNPFSDRAKSKDAIPLLINNYLYWKLESEQGYKYDDGHNDIMEFDIIREEFMVIPCPVPLNTECKSYQTHLLNSDGVLSFLLILPKQVTIWILEDHAQRLWTTTEYTFDIEIYDSREVAYRVNVRAVVDGKLAIQLDRILCVCNFMDGTVIYYPDIRIPAKISFISHQMSLASLSNGKTKIFIDQDDNVVVT